MPVSAGAIRAGRAFVELFADDSKLVRGLRRAERKVKAFGESIRNIGLRMLALGSAVLAPLAASAKAFSGYGDQMAKMSARTGIGVEALSELAFAAEQSGADVETLELGIRRMQQSLDQAARGSRAAKEALARLGLTAADLKGLAPEEQLKLLADRLAQVADPTNRAALALELFGRSGTRLLPLLSSGAAGIKALMEEARRLGLTLSAEDAQAAVEFKDTLNRLWKVLRMGVFQVGAALAPTLKDLAQRLTSVATKVVTWIKTNQQVIVTVLRVAAAVAGAGIALVVLGAIISGLGSAIGVLVTVVTAVGVVFKAVAAVIGFIISPVGAVITAVAALGGYLVYASGAGGKALTWLGQRFNTLKEDAIAAYEGIADALAAGDIGLAVKVLWLTLKMEWTRGIGWLKNTWADFKAWFLRTWTDIKEGALAAWEIVQHNLTVGFIEVKSQLKKWWADLKGLFDWDKPQWQIEEEKRAAEAERKASRGVETQRHEEELSSIVKAASKAQAEIAAENAARLAETEADLAEAREAWQDAIAAARRAREAKAEGGPGIEAPSAPDLSDLLAEAVDRITTRGTFYAYAVGGLEVANDAMRRTAVATERTARNTDALLRRSGVAFV